MPSTFTESVYRRAPGNVQDLLVGVYGGYLAFQRYGPAYFRWKRFYRESARWSRDRLEAYQAERLTQYVRHAFETSHFHRERLKGVDLGVRLLPEALDGFPVMTKAEARSNADRIATTKRGVHVHTGGTTGTPLEVVYTSRDFQERQARITVFREQHGAFHRMRRATFSGRIVAPSQNGHGRLWRHNWALNQRLYSSFHLTPENLDRYVEDLEIFRPEWIDGFPSSVFAVAKHAADRGNTFSFRPRAVFSTSETLYEWQRDTIRAVFGCETRNQYASAEGAPFIVECPEGALHMDLRTGVFESSPDGLLVTSFTTSGFPLIRYAIGDRVEMGAGPCVCGDQNPTVKGVYGRDQDSIQSVERGPVFVGLVDIFKSIPAVVSKSQIAQTSPTDVELRLVMDAEALAPEHEARLLEGLRDRLGGGMKITVKLVEDIERDKSGKYRFIKQEYK